MLKECKKNGMPYVFFNPEDNKLYSEKGDVANDIELFIKSIYSIKNQNNMITNYFSLNKSYIILNEQMNDIINFLSNKLQKQIKNLKFVEKVNIIENSNKYIYISIPNDSTIMLLFYENENLRLYDLKPKKKISIDEKDKFFLNKYKIELEF